MESSDSTVIVVYTAMRYSLTMRDLVDVKIRAARAAAVATVDVKTRPHRVHNVTLVNVGQSDLGNLL